MPRRLSLAPWTHQPPELVDITSDASLRNGLTSIALPWGVLRPNARGQTAYASGSTISGYVACRDGLSIHFGTADSAAGALLVSGDLAFETVAISRYNTTRIANVERRTSGTTRRAISATAAAGAGELLWRMESGATPELVASGVALVLTATSSFSAGDRHVIGMRLTAGASNTTWSHWRNGVQLNAAADTTALTAGSAPHIGGVSGSTNAARSDIGIPLHINWSRALSDTEMRDVMLAVWQRMLAPRRIWVPVSAGATPRSATASLSVAVQQARTATSSVAAAIQAGRTASASVAAAVQLGRTATASAAAAVQAPRTATASVATAVQDAHTASAALAAAVQRGVTATASIAAALQAARTATASASAAVQESHTATASVTAYVQAGQTVSASLSAAVQAARTAQASVAAAVQAPHTAQASLATAIAEARSVTTSLAAAVQQARSTSASISAQIQAGTTVVAQINAAILEARTASASIAAAVAVARSASASLAAAVAVSATLTAAIQAAVLRARSATAAVAAYISTPGDHTIAPRLYLVDAQDRAYLIDPEDRTYIVPASDRSSAA